MLRKGDLAFECLQFLFQQRPTFVPFDFGVSTSHSELLKMNLYGGSSTREILVKVVNR